MSNAYLDGDTIERCHQALRDGQTLEALAGRLHVDTELLGRLLGLPTSRPAAAPTDDSCDLWAADKLNAVL